MPEEIIIPVWPLTVTLPDDTELEVTGLSGNCYVVAWEGKAIGLESPTTASDTNAQAEVPALFADYLALNA